MGSVVVIGGYGNAGRPIVEQLCRRTDRTVVVAGRSLDRARALVAELAQPRLRAARVDAADPESVRSSLLDAEVLVVAAGTSATWQVTAREALARGCHQVDIQIGSAKTAGLRALDAQARSAGVSIVTDGGFHPGVPAAMVRRVLLDHDQLAAAVVSSWIALDWSALGRFADSTVAEMVTEFADYRYEALVAGRWVAPRRTRPVTFPPPVGRQRVAAMGLAEMREIVARVPSLRDAGFYVGGFPPEVNYAVIPAVYAGMRVAPQRAAGPSGRLLDWSLRRFSRPPYATYLQLDGGPAGRAPETLMRLHHHDAYLLTAAPVVACVQQLLDGELPTGVHLQAMVVQPRRFFADLSAMGVTVENPA